MDQLGNLGVDDPSKNEDKPDGDPLASMNQAFGASLGSDTGQSDKPLAGFRAKRVAATPAGFWRRFGAYTLDSFILGMMLLPITMSSAIFQVLVLERFTGEDSGMYLAIYGILQMVSMVVSYGGQVVYYGYFYSRYGASLGKMVLGLKVVSLNDGTYLTFWRAGLRDLVGKMFLNTITLGIGWLMVAFHPTKRGLHDLVFDSQVIHLKKY